MLAVIGTVAVWYVGDAYYNDYAHSYYLIFTSDVLSDAWWQVGWFLIVFVVAAPYVHRWINARYLRSQSGVLQLVRFGINQPSLQSQLDVLFKGCVMIYAIIVLVAATRIKGEMLYFFCPYLGYKPEVWGRARIGSGFDALLSFAEYVQMMVSAIFGVLAAVSNNRRVRTVSLVLCLIAWPYYLFDRTRNTILAVVIPGLLSWVFLRLRGGIFKKVVVLTVCYILIDGWMGFIIQNRSNENIATAFAQKGFDLEKETEVHHQGLNMFEELCWINTFIKKGTYEPNWGARYFAELANPIPRAIWHNKPEIGIDYAIARGQGIRGNGGARGKQEAGVYATISTGMIGEGVVNFGRIFGPAAAALLMAFWVAILARQDLQIWKLGRLPLYALGMILTFNLGRDITFITLYPFVFLAAALWWMDRRSPATEGGPAPIGPNASASQNFPQNPDQPHTGRVRLRRVLTKRGRIVTRRARIVTRSRLPSPPQSELRT